MFHFDPETGIFTRKTTVAPNARKGDVAGWNYAGGYLGITADGKQYVAHRLAWLYVHGEWPDQIDHIDHNRQNNKINNLRNANFSVNSKNVGPFSTNKAGVHGVCLYKPTGKWKAQIGVNGKSIHLGYFDTKEAAAAARSAANKKYGFHENHGKAA